MPSLALISSLALGLLAFNPIMVQASPIPATHVELAARSFASGGTSCYYKCPPTMTSGATYTNGITEGPFTYHCNYSSGDYCHYNPSTGAFTGGGSACRPQADFAGCKSQAGAGEFKREMPKRVLTEAERAIQDRQYHPVKL